MHAKKRSPWRRRRRQHGERRRHSRRRKRAARGQADEKAEELRREDYVNRVNRAYREMQDDNVALAEDLLHGCPPERSRLGVALRRAALQFGTPGPRSR